MTTDPIWDNLALELARRGPRKPYVYFALFQEEGLDPIVKIGKSSDVPSRMQALARHDPKAPDWLAWDAYEPHLIGIIEGDEELERAIHRALAHWRIDREFFWYEGEATIFIDDLLSDYCACQICEALDTGRA
jgi:hypothetical protein